MPFAAAETPGELAVVSTVLTPDERLRVDAAGAGCFRTMHRDSLDEVRRDLREARSAAVLLSVGRCDGSTPLALARLVREHPRAPAIALVSDVDARTPGAALALGRAGAGRLVDVRSPRGWQELRQLLAKDRLAAIERRLLAIVHETLAGAPIDCLRFFEAIIVASGRVRTIRALAPRLGVCAPTLTSRFFRAGLPAPKRYLAVARLARAAWLLENPGVAVTVVAARLGYSSPQSFNRHVRLTLGMTADVFRRTCDGEAMIDRFRRELLVPYLTTLRTFHPLGAVLGPQDLEPRAGPRDLARAA
jgi:AraC-like DNA-binding protein